MQANKAIRLFDKYNLIIPSELNCYEDGIPGRRVMFITDRAENFTISFEEGMRLLDMIFEHPEEKATVSSQYCKDGKYIHQRRKKCGRYALFHIELDDDDGTTLFLPGQMIVEARYQWSNGIEPVLIKLLEGISV